MTCPCRRSAAVAALRRFLVLLAMLAPLSVQAAALPRYGSFYFSSECYERESGDTAGNRAILVRTRDEDSLLWYWSEGPLFGPASAYHLKIDARGNIAFTVDTGSQVGEDSGGHPSVGPPLVNTLKGTISDTALVVDGARLPRRTNFATKIGECR